MSTTRTHAHKHAIGKSVLFFRWLLTIDTVQYGQFYIVSPRTTLYTVCYCIAEHRICMKYVAVDDITIAHGVCVPIISFTKFD